MSHTAARSADVDLLVIGLGYVGLPLAAEALRSGMTVAGFDVNPAVVSGLNAGRSHVGDISDAEVRYMIARGFFASNQTQAIGHPAVISICVPTPLTEDAGPDLSAVRASTQVAASLLSPGTLVVLESTTYPGTTDEVVAPILAEATGLTPGLDFELAFSPERIDPGNPDFGVRNTPKIVGGITPSSTDAAALFYGKICDQVVRASSAREAEMAKLLENTYRHVNIALVNELAVLCRELNIDLWDAIRCASTKPFGFQAFYPGPGVGGHCIPIDPSYLAYRVRKLGYQFRFVDLARDINNRMPSYVVARAADMLNKLGKPMNGAQVLLLGVSYKKDSADLRESPAFPIARRLRQADAHIQYVDPNVSEWIVDGNRIDRAIDAPRPPADIAILLQAHSAFDWANIHSYARLILDTRGTLSDCERL